MSSGFGVSYRRYLNEIIAVRAEGLMGGNKDGFRVSFGVSAQEDFLRTFYYRLYGLQGIAIHHFLADSTSLAPGAGVGFEYNFTGLRKGFAVRGELVLTGVIELQDEDNLGLQLLTPLPQVGASYVF